MTGGLRHSLYWMWFWSVELGILGTVLMLQFPPVSSDVESSIQIDIPNSYCKQHGVKIGKMVEVKLCTNLMSPMEHVVFTEY